LHKVVEIALINITTKVTTGNKPVSDENSRAGTAPALLL
jgi:hypothetical protein